MPSGSATSTTHGSPAKPSASAKRLSWVVAKVAYLNQPSNPRFRTREPVSHRRRTADPGGAAAIALLIIQSAHVAPTSTNTKRGAPQE